jgi:alcohol dehydrogenase class IV
MSLAIHSMLMVGWRCFRAVINRGNPVKKILIMSALACAASLSFRPSAFAQEEAMEQMLCPLEKIGDEKAEAMSVALSDVENEANDALAAEMEKAVNQCAAEKGWTEKQTEQSTKFSATLLSAMGLEQRLADAGIVASDYEELLEEKTPAELAAYVENAAESPITGAVVDMLQKEQSDKFSETNAGHLNAYLVQLAQVQLLTMEIMGITK